MENGFDDIKVKKLPPDVFTTLADLLTYDWEKFAQFLLVDDSAIDDVKNKFETTREQTVQIINHWHKNNPSKKWRDVKDGLLFCNRKDLVSECERKLISRHSRLGVLPPIKNFFSRDDELYQIHKRVCESNESGKSITVLTGMSGVGKTQLARKYAATYNEYFERIVWVDAASNKLQVSISNLCHLLGLSIKDSLGNIFDNGELSRKIHNYFEKEKTLFIFDNVDDKSSENFEEYVSNKKSAFTLVTSQWKLWSSDIHQVQINPFSKQDAFLFMKRNIKTNDGDEEIKEITEVLWYYPFAINKAILYINTNRVSLQEYLDLFRSNPIEMLEESIPTETETKSPIILINLVLIQMETSHEKAVEILNHLSYCDGRLITKKFIHGISKHLKIKDDYSIYGAIRMLVSYSLLDCLEGNNERYAMHEITQLACKYLQKCKQIAEICSQNIVEFLRLQLEEVNEHIDDGQQFYNHFVHMCLVNKSEMLEAFHQQGEKIRTFLSNKGFFQEAINILDAIQNYNVEFYGAEHLITLVTKANIATCLNDMGKCNEALEINYQVDKMQTDILEINHPSTLRTKNDIAYSLYRMGKYNEALKIYYQVDKLRTDTFGINHPSTLASKNNIANCLNRMGKYNEALEIYYQVNKIRTDILGANHTSTFDSKNNIANCLYGMRKYDETLEIYYQLDKIQTDILGINHPSTLRTKNDIEICLKRRKMANSFCELF